MVKKILLLSLIMVATGLFSQAKDFTVTGSGVRVKKVAFVSVNVYNITHAMKDVPAKNAAEIIAADTDKKFTLKLMRDLDAEKIANAIKDAFTANGYTNSANINSFSAVLTGDLKENDLITIAYNSATKATTCNSGGKTSSINGVDFMKATWSIWFGKIDQPALTQSLMSKIP
jgi:hypothetical protein